MFKKFKNDKYASIAFYAFVVICLTVLLVFTALNIGAIWNVISLWIHRGMQESPNEVRNTIEQYLTRLKQTKT